MALSTEQTPDEVWTQIRQYARNLKAFAASRSTEFSAGTTRERVLRVYTTLIAYEVQLNARKDVPGLREYVRMLKNDPANDVVADVVATLAALSTVIDNIFAIFPKSGNAPLVMTMTRAGVEDKNLTATQLSGVITDLDAVANGIV